MKNQFHRSPNAEKSRSLAKRGSSGLRALIIPLGLLATITDLAAVDLHVDPGHSGEATGSADSPFSTLAAARDAARKWAGKEAVTIHVADGIYYLPDTFVLGPEDSGSKDHPIIYQAVNEGQAVISGGIKLDLEWKKGPGASFVADTPEGLELDQLFVEGKRQRMARYPDFDPSKVTAAYQGYAADAFSVERSSGWRNPVGAYIHAMHKARWGGYHYRITGKNPDGSVAYEGGWQNNRQMGMHGDFRMVENVFEELNAPGEWFHDVGSRRLHLIPESGVEVSKAKIEAVRLRHLIELKGSISEPVRWVQFRGFLFRHTARTFMETKEPLLRSDWTIYRGGALLISGGEDIEILDCEFDQPGGNAIFVNNYNRRVRIKGCHIHNAGASGVCFVGDPAAVRNPLFEYGQTHDLSKIDRTPGPRTENYPADSVVEDCLIHGIGRVERQPAGVQISMARRITVRDVSIYDCARAGINISEGTWGGHLIERCDVFDTVLETHDHGSFNSWGRDRYWISNHRGISEPEVKRDPNLPFLDAMELTVIRDSRWRCDHGWDIDLDDGSSNYEIYNNLMLAGGLKLREGYGRRVHNNIHVNNALHPHVWFDESGDRFSRNIVMAAQAPIGQPEGWGRGVDGNLFAFEQDLEKSRGFGSDSGSLSGDPMFIDPEVGDFRVKAGSPAFALGFENFPMNQFGVKKPRLKALARTPEIPPLRRVRGPSSNIPAIRFIWLGARLHSLQGEEFSAFGVSKEEGGVQLVDVPEGSVASVAGLLKNDLIQGINGEKVSNTNQLMASLLKLGSGSIRLRLIRNQSPLDLQLSGQPFTTAETSSEPDGFRKLIPQSGSMVRVLSNTEVSNHPIESLIDGEINHGYGAVFANGVSDGAFLIDLGRARPIQSLSAWSFNQNGNRGRQIISFYGSNSATEPGWALLLPYEPLLARILGPIGGF
ncbi:MAG: PDZ domain-containing protein [Akkermansiaceae bacterium]|nr:PDZ domain-containing protein [Akkermansiaceae bacterium]